MSATVRPEARAERRHVHIERIAIRWGDMDAMGHVNNTIYFRYMEQARISWFDALVARQPTRGGAASVIVNASCTFIKQLVYPGDVAVRMYAGKAGRSSSTSARDAAELRPRHGLCGGRGESGLDRSRAGRSVPLPDRIRQIIDG